MSNELDPWFEFKIISLKVGSGSHPCPAHNPRGIVGSIGASQWVNSHMESGFYTKRSRVAFYDDPHYLLQSFHSDLFPLS